MSWQIGAAANVSVAPAYVAIAPALLAPPARTRTSTSDLLGEVGDDARSEPRRVVPAHLGGT